MDEIIRETDMDCYVRLKYCKYIKNGSAVVSFCTCVTYTCFILTARKTNQTDKTLKAIRGSFRTEGERTSAFSHLFEGMCPRRRCAMPVAAPISRVLCIAGESFAMGMDLAHIMEICGKACDRTRPAVPFLENPDQWLVAFRDAYGPENEDFDALTHGLGPMIVKCVINR